MLMHAGDTMMPGRGMEWRSPSLDFRWGGQGGGKCTIGLKVTFKQKGSALP